MTLRSKSYLKISSHGPLLRRTEREIFGKQIAVAHALVAASGRFRGGDMRP
jgi:hypothetical protein